MVPNIFHAPINNITLTFMFVYGPGLHHRLHGCLLLRLSRMHSAMIATLCLTCACNCSSTLEARISQHNVKQWICHTILRSLVAA